MVKNVLIVNYNTTLLTQCCVKSVNKFTPGCKIYVFDNSDKEPFVNIFENVEVIDNTKGQIINWDEWKKEYVGDRKTKGSHNNYASAKHCYSVQKCMDLINEPFVLLDSDVLIKKDFSSFYNKDFVFVSDVEPQAGYASHNRVIPYICYINTTLCKEKNIAFFNENYMHGLGHGDGDNWDTGTYFFDVCKNEKYKKIKNTDYIVHYKAGSWNKKKLRVKSQVNEWLNNYRQYWKEMINKKVVYTCISGDYDNLLEPEFVTEGYDYVCFTDQDFMSKVWEIRPIPEELKNLSEVKRQRNIKINPHKYLSEYEFSVWVDGNISLKGDINKYVEKNCTEKDCVMFVGIHPQRDCVYEEGEACIKLKKDTKENVNRQLNIYREEGFPEHYGLPQTGIIFRYHNNESCKRLMEAWWEQLEKYSHRDQLSFNYVLWKNQDVKIQYLNKNIFNCETFKWNVGHKKTKITNKTKEKMVKKQVKKTTPVVKKVVKKETPKVVKKEVKKVESKVVKKIEPPVLNKKMSCKEKLELLNKYFDEINE